jgi:hypothetical protein
MFNQDLLFSTQSLAGSPVKVYYRGTNIGSIVGPEPLVDIAKSFNANSNNIVESVTNQIDLTGKILSTTKAATDTNGSTGISGIIVSIKKLEDLFSCSHGLFEIKCNDETMYSISGVRVTNLSINKSENNWTQTADYAIGLEFTTAVSGSDNVSDRSESWTIEPQDDISYINNIYGVSSKPESPPGFGSFSPSVGGVIGALNGIGTMGSSAADVTSIPQFRISRRLSAKGIPIPSGTGCLSIDESIKQNNKSYLYAKAWVEKQLKKPFSGSDTAGGSPYFPNSTGTHLYNHARTTNIDIYNGTYEVNDSWLAMPEKIGYIETFNIERSTSAEYITTVRVAGSLQGLIETPQNIMDGTSGVMPTGSGLDNPINLKFSEYNGLESSNTTLSNNIAPRKTKYDSAKDGWIQKVKPMLYRRASLAINSYDRNSEYNDLNPVPQNTHPNFSLENVLNVVPVSTSESHDPNRGTINYSYEFNNRTNMLASVWNGVLSENISVTVDSPVDNTSETQIIGRQLGPIITSNGKTTGRKSISVEVVVVPPSSPRESIQTDPSCPLYRTNPLWQNIDLIIEGHRPFGNRTNALFENSVSQPYGTVFTQSDSESWTPSQGRYSRSVTWIFQQCTIDRHHMDH